MADEKSISDFTADLNPVSGSELGRGISRGVLQVGEGLAGFGEIFADLVGADTAKTWLKTQGNSLAELSRNIPRAVESFTEIRDIPSLGAYAAAAIGELVPQIGVSFGAGLAARGAAVGGRALVRGMAGAGATSYAQESGGIYRGIREETGQEAPKTALAFGAPAAALDTLLPARFLGKLFGEATGEAAKKVSKEAWGSLVRRSFVEAAKSAPIEGLTEGAQESIAISANRFADQTYEVVNGKNFIRVLDAGLQGVIGGALIGGATPAIETAVKKRKDANATQQIIEQPGAVTEPARDVPVVQTQGTEERAPRFDSGIIRRPAPGTEAPLASTGPASIVTPAQDAEYLAAVARGDTATAQRMVDEAARAAGFNVKAYHGTDREFNAFDTKRAGDATKGLGDIAASYFAADRGTAEGVSRWSAFRSSGTPRVVEAYLKVQNPIENQTVLDDRLSREQIIARGHDAKIYTDDAGDVAEYGIFDPSQIKSADAITRDESGAPIPLSQRFNPASPDIRYSVGPKGWAVVSGVPSLSVDKVQSAVADLSQRYGVTVEVLPTPPTSLDHRFATASGITMADGRVQLFASNIQEAEAARAMFFHEVAVHLGIQRAAKTPVEQRQLAAIANSVAPRIMRMADEISRRGGYANFKALAERYGLDLATPDGKQRAVFELLAREAQRYAGMKTPPGWWRQLLGKLKAFLGRIFKFDIGDDGVYAIVTKGLSQAGKAQQRAGVAPNATTQQPLASLGPTLRKSDLEETLAFTPQPAIREAEAIMASGQVTDILGMFRNWIEQLVPTSWRARVQGITEFQRLGGINDYIAGTLMIDPRTFVQAKAQMPNDGMRTLMDLHLSNGMNYVEARALAIKQNLESQRALVESSGMRQKIINAMSHLERSNVADDAKRRIVSQIKNGIVRAQRRARESGGNQAVFDEAQEQLRFYESLQTRVPELQSAVDAIINSIALDPQSVEGVMGGVMPNEATLLRNHLAVTARPESTTDSRGNRRNEGLALLRVAANIISRSQQLARKALASQWAEDSEVSREASGIEDRIKQSVDTGNMRQELDRALRSVASLATAAGKAAAVFRIRQRFIVRAFEQFTNLQYADQVFNAVLASFEYRTLRNAVGAATGERIVPAAAKGVALESAFRSKHVVVMPDGTARDFTMAPDRKTWDEQMADTDGRKGIETTLAELRAWIDNPANENDPTRPFYESQVRDLEYLWHGSFVYDSPKIYTAFRRFHFKALDAFLKQFDSLITNIGIRGSSSLRTIASVMKDSMHLFGDWMTKSDPVYTRAMIEGAKSHADIWSAQTGANAIDLWYDEVLNPLFASHQDPARPGYRTGEVIPESGRKVTAQDAAARVQMARLSKQSHEIDAVQNRMAVVPSVLVEDTMVPGAPHHRRAMTISEGQVPRRTSRKAIDLVSQYLKSEELKQDRFAFWDVPHRFFDVKSMIANRDAQHSTLSDFEDAFQEVKTELQRGLDDSEITDLSSMVAFIEERVDSEPNEVRDFILTEMDRHVRAVASAVDALRAQVTEPPSKVFGTTSVKPVDRTTSFTTGRGRAIAPPWAYEYGWRDTRAIMDYAMSGNSFYVELFIKTLLSAADELRTYQKNVIAPRIAALEKEHGDKQKAREVWLSQNRENLRLGNDLVEWERVDDFANSLESYARSFNEQYSVGGKEVDVRLAVGDRVLSRFVTGVLFGWGTTVRNALEGGFVHNGIRLSRLSGGVFGAFPQAGFSVAKVILPMAWRALPAAVKGAWQTASNLPRAVRTLATTGNLVKAEGQLLADSIETMAMSLMGQSDIARGLERRGLGLPVLPKAVLENQAELWRTSGQIRQVDLDANPVWKFLQSTAQYGATFIDANLALWAKPFFPRVGDVIANQAVADTTFSAMRQLEKRLAILHRTMRDAGMDTSNLGNRQFTPNEVLGRYFGFDRTTTALRELEGLFIDAQLDFHKSIADWFQRIDRIGDDQRWLQEDALWRLAMRNVEVINAPTALNRAMAIKKNIATRTIGALLGWNLSAYRKYADYIGRSVRDDKTVWRVRLAVALWIFAMLNMAGASNEAIELIMRRIAELFGDPARATRVPWEFDKPSDAIKNHAIYAFNTVPFVATAVNAAFNDMPNKASLSPFLLIQNKALDIVNYIGGAVNSGDPLYKLPQLIRGFVPLSSVVINRLPEIAGMREATSVARLYTRYGDKEDLAKPFARSGPGASASVTALSPYGDRITSALLRGDDQEATALYTRAIEVAKQVGKPNPEQSVKSLIINRLPISRAFKSTPSASDYSRLLSRMSPNDRTRVERFNATAEQGLAKLGITTEKIRPLAAKPTAGSTRGRTARSRSGYRTSRVRRVRLGGSRNRSRLGTRRRRNSLVRQAV